MTAGDYRHREEHFEGMATTPLQSPEGRLLTIERNFATSTASTCYLAREITSRDYVVAKKWSLRRGFDRTCWRNLYILQQLQVLSDHTSIFASLYGWFKIGDAIWLIGEYTAGRSLVQLQKFLRESIQDPARCLTCHLSCSVAP